MAERRWARIPFGSARTSSSAARATAVSPPDSAIDAPQAGIHDEAAIDARIPSGTRTDISTTGLQRTRSETFWPSRAERRAATGPEKDSPSSTNPSSGLSSGRITSAISSKVCPPTVGRARGRQFAQAGASATKDENRARLPWRPGRRTTSALTRRNEIVAERSDQPGRNATKRGVAPSIRRRHRRRIAGSPGEDRPARDGREDDGPPEKGPGRRPLAEPQERPQRIEHGLEHAEERRLRRRHDCEAAHEEDVADAHLDDSEEKNEQDSSPVEREVGEREREREGSREEIPRDDRGNRVSRGVPPKAQDHEAEEEARHDRHEIPREGAGVEPPDEEERHA